METRALRRIALGKSAGALLVALCAGMIALAAPPAALFLLAVLAARALMREGQMRIDLSALAGPALAAIIVAMFAGAASAIGLLFAWRVWCDAHWSVREAARLARAAGRANETNFAALAHAWTTPVYGLALVAYTAPHLVAGLPLDLPHLPAFIPMAFAMLALAAVFDWALRRAADWRLGEIAPAPAMHLLCHHALFVIAFGMGLDVSSGLVALIAWRLAHAQPQVSFTAVP